MTHRYLPFLYGMAAPNLEPNLQLAHFLRQINV